MQELSVQNGGTTLTLKSENLTYEVEADGFHWVSEGRRAHLVFQKKIFGKYRWYFTPFSSARQKSHKIVGNSIVSTFQGFLCYGKRLPTVFIATATVLEDGKVDFSLEAQNEADCAFKAAYYPAPFNAKSYDKQKAYSVDPYRQGFILPDTHKENRKQIFLMTKYWRKINTGDAYLPAWGRVCGDYGYSALLDESYDATLFSAYGKKRAFLTGCNWIGSLGQLRYKRTLHMRFYKHCSYVTIAKDFRKQEQEKGNFVTIDEKIKRNPNVKKLIGTPVIHWSLLEHNEKTSDIYKQRKIYERVHNTFADTEQKFRIFKECGLEKAYVHADGWGNRGYDNLHPYVLPPSEKLGGYDGMKHLAETCRELGYTFGLHDQYRDYYQDSPVYDKNKCVLDVNGKAYYCDVWAGGAHNWLCSKFAKEYVKRTYDELEAHGVAIGGTYLDVFGIMWGDECYDPKHRITRRESIAYRGECFDMLRDRGLIVSSEELGAQMVKYLDLVHHAPYGVTPQGGGVAVGIPVPFANLVYHDCVFVPWLTEGKGGWGIPDGDSGRMHCILNAQTPYLNNSMCPASYETDKTDLKMQIQKVQEVAKINERLYNQELLNHEFLDDNYRVQRTTFADGTRITVDFDKDEYKVEYKEQ